MYDGKTEEHCALVPVGSTGVALDGLREVEEFLATRVRDEWELLQKPEWLPHLIALGCRAAQRLRLSWGAVLLDPCVSAGLRALAARDPIVKERLRFAVIVTMVERSQGRKPAPIDQRWMLHNFVSGAYDRNNSFGWESLLIVLAEMPEPATAEEQSAVRFLWDYALARCPQSLTAGTRQRLASVWCRTRYPLALDTQVRALLGSAV